MKASSDLLSQSDDELLRRIGDAVLMQASKGVIPPNLEASISAAKEWLAAQKDLLCSIVCSDQRVKALLKEGQFGKELMFLVIDVLEHHLLKLFPVPPAAAAILFCRYAYYRFCAEHP